MISILKRIFIKDHENYKDQNVRRAYGMLCSIVGIFLNICLFAGKYFAGVITNSIAITADAFNNLSDAGSSIITLIGFKLSGRKPDPEHPFGHGRIEYLSGLAVSLAILLMGFELAKSSVEKIISPEAVDSSLISFVILIASIAVKIYMSIYNAGIAKKISSATMKAVSTDSLSDSVATTVVLVAMLIGKFTGINIDGYCGVLVALFILYAGFNSAKETIAPLLGQPPEEEFVKEIEEIVVAHDIVSGIHDLVVHDYGPGRVMISLHAEVPGDGDIFEIHDEIDQIEQELREKLECEACIHMDPIEMNNESVKAMRDRVKQLVKEYDEIITIHDFRMVTGPTHTNLIFDAVIPAGYKTGAQQVKEELARRVSDNLENCFAVIQIDTSYV